MSKVERTMPTPEQRAQNIVDVKKVNEIRKTDGISVKEACVKVGIPITKYNYYNWQVLKKASPTPRKKVSVALAKRPIEHQTIVFPESNTTGHVGSSDKVVFFMGSSQAVESLKEILTTLINR